MILIINNLSYSIKLAVETPMLLRDQILDLFTTSQVILVVILVAILVVILVVILAVILVVILAHT